MKIGILVCGHRSAALADWKGYDSQFHALLDGYGFEFTSYWVVDGEFPASPSEQDGWIITGSKHGTYEALPWIAPLEDFLRAAYEASAPILGICFGHQILAQALGGVNEKFDGGWNIGHQTYDLQGPNAGESCAIMAWHQDQVTQAPESAEILASAPRCAHAMLHYPGRAFTMQAHPEFNAAFTQDLLDKDSTGLPEDHIARAARDMQNPLSTQKLAGAMAHFLKTKELRFG